MTNQLLNLLSLIKFFIDICKLLKAYSAKTPEEREDCIKKLIKIILLYIDSSDHQRKAICNEAKKILDREAVENYRDIIGIDVLDNEMVLFDPRNKCSNNKC